VETILLLQRAITVLCGGYNLAHFARSWHGLGRREPKGLDSGAGVGRRNGRRVAAAVLAITNLAFLVTGVMPLVTLSLPVVSRHPGAQALAGLFPLAAVLAMTVLILRAQGRG
jgi:hypothetical protein